MVGHGWQLVDAAGWQLIEAAPGGEARPVPLACAPLWGDAAETDAPQRTLGPADSGAGNASRAGRRAAAADRGRVVERVRILFRAIAAQAGGAQTVPGARPPRWPSRGAP